MLIINVGAGFDTPVVTELPLDTQGYRVIDGVGPKGITHVVRLTKKKNCKNCIGTTEKEHKREDTHTNNHILLVSLDF